MKLRSREISAAKARALLSSTEYEIDAELSARLGMLVVYRLTDGRALVTLPFDLSGRLYDSYEQMVKSLEEMEKEAKRGAVSLAEDLKLDENFPTNSSMSLADRWIRWSLSRLRI